MFEVFLGSFNIRNDLYSPNQYAQLTYSFMQISLKICTIVLAFETALNRDDSYPMSEYNYTVNTNRAVFMLTFMLQLYRLEYLL